MNKLNIEQLRVVQAKPRVSGSRVGKIVSLHDPKIPIVDYPGNPLGPQPARVMSAMTGRLALAHGLQSPILMVFEEDDPSRPVIIDTVLDGRAAGSAPNGPNAMSFVPEPNTPSPEPAQIPPAAVSAKLATITAVEEDGVLIRFAEQDTLQAKVRTAIALRNLKDPVIVLMLANEQPIIVGQVYDRVPIEPAGGEDAEVVLKGSRVRIEAEVELILTAGACSLHFDARGKVVTTANQIVSRARDSNKVQGGSVQLN